MEKPALISLKNQNGLQLILCNLGASWHSCLVPVAGKLREILLGSANPIMNLDNDAYLGATVGRYAGRIARGKYRRKGRTYQMRTNQPPHCLHGGIENFSRRLWEITTASQNKVIFSLFSPHGEEGFAGNLRVKVSYELDEENNVIITWEAQSDRETVINLTNHAYFNLNGDPENDTSLDGLQQHLHINADYFVPVTAQGIPSARRQIVSAGMDFRQPKRIADNFLHDYAQQVVAGYDHSYLLKAQKHPHATLSANNHDLRLHIHTSQPAIHIYSGQFLHGTPNRHGGIYQNHAGIAIETQAPPDSPNRRYPLVRLKPNQRYQHQTRYQFESKA